MKKKPMLKVSKLIPISKIKKEIETGKKLSEFSEEY